MNDKTESSGFDFTTLILKISYSHQSGKGNSKFNKIQIKERERECDMKGGYCGLLKRPNRLPGGNGNITAFFSPLRGKMTPTETAENNWKVIQLM
jgi:hypothetical protein